MAVARNALGDLAREHGASESDVKLAVSEAVTNSVLHAYRDRDPGTITLQARIDRSRLLIAVGDDGSGMRPNLESTGLGLGISLITKLATDVRFDSTDRGTTVSMSFPVVQQPAVAGEPMRDAVPGGLEVSVTSRRPTRRGSRWCAPRARSTSATPRSWPARSRRAPARRATASSSTWPGSRSWTPAVCAPCLWRRRSCGRCSRS